MKDTLGRDNRKHSNKACANCGGDFRPKGAHSKYCSRRCLWAKNGGQNRKPETCWTDTKGYLQGRVWIGGKQVRVKKHRWIMERHLGRALLLTEDVHHKDGDKQNNDISNLEVIAHSDHTRITNQRPYKKGYRLKLTASARADRSKRAKMMGLGNIGRAAIAKAEGR